MRGKALFIFGVSQYSALIADYFHIESDYNVEGFVVDDDFKSCDFFYGLNVYSLTRFQGMFSPSNADIFCAIGYKSMRMRREIYKKIRTLGYSSPSLISQSAYISPKAIVGSNSVVMPHAVVEAGTKVGENVVVWSNSTICHDSQIGDGCFIAANTTVGGGVRMEELCFLGFSSTVIQSLNVGSETLLGAMSLLLKDSIAYTKYCGIPAKKISTHKEDGIFLHD